MSAVRVEPCHLQHPVFLPVLLRSSPQQPLVSAQITAAVAPKNLDSVQHFYLYEGGQVRLPPKFGGNDPLCLDVRDVWNHEYLDGLGGPEPGQLLQTFTCLDAQLNQRWNLTGDILSGDKCLSLASSGTQNGAAATMALCNGSAKQDWDYYW